MVGIVIVYEFFRYMSWCFVVGMCLEKRAFYRVVSGLHTSINIHLSARYIISGQLCVGCVYLNASTFQST